MAMVSSCINSVPSVPDASQPVGVELFGHRTPGPRSPFADFVEGVGVNLGGVTITLNDCVMNRCESFPVLWRHAVERQDGQIVTFVVNVSPGVAMIFTQQTGRIVFGVTLDEHNLAICHFFGRDAPTNLVGLDRYLIAGVLE